MYGINEWKNVSDEIAELLAEANSEQKTLVKGILIGVTISQKSKKEKCSERELPEA